jgi:hypothetical protein
MPTPDWIAETEQIIGANDPSKADTRNRAVITEQSMLIVEHNADGKHIAGETALIGEIGSFVGNGTNQTITLSNTNLTPKKVYVWEYSNIADCYRWDIFSSWSAIPNGAKKGRASANALVNNIIDNFQAGSFDVEDTINRNGITNYYFVIGTGRDPTDIPTGNPGAGSDPSWVESSVLNLMQGDDTAGLSTTNLANYVESQMWTNFIVEHSSEGVHLTQHFPFITESGTYTGNGVNPRTITLSNISLDIKYIMCVLETSGTFSGVRFTDEDMTGGTDTKLEDNTAGFFTTAFNGIGTGSFDVETILNQSGKEFFWFAIGERS